MNILEGRRDLGNWHMMRDGVVWRFPSPIDNEPHAFIVATEMTQLNEEFLTVPREAGPYVYLHFGAGDELLYVGSTSSPMSRFANHVANRKRSPWFSDVADIVWLRCIDARTMPFIENTLIAHLHPRYNKQGRPTVDRPSRSLDRIEDVDVRLLVGTVRREHLDDTLNALATGAVA